MSLSPELRAKAVLEVQLRLSSGASRRDSISLLESHGIPFRDARQIVDGMTRGGRQNNRFAGGTRIVLGLLCGGFSSMLFYVGISAPSARLGLRALGVIAAITALSLLVRGARLLMIGHADSNDG